MATKDVLAEALIERLWAQWVALGAEAHALAEIQTVDPEALIATTAIVGMQDARLAEVALGWLEIYGDLINTSRFKRISRELDAGTSQLWASFDAQLRGMTSEGPISSRPAAVSRKREFITAATMVLRIRAFSGVNARADVIAFLLTHPESSPNVTELARHLRFTRGAVAQAVRGLGLSGAVRAADGNVTLDGRDGLARTFGPIEVGEVSWVDTFAVALAALRALEATPVPTAIAVDRVMRQFASNVLATDLTQPPLGSGADAHGAFDRWTDEIASRLKLDRLFSQRRRVDELPSRPSETTFSFLDRAAGETWDRVRALWDSWFVALPGSARNDVGSRLRSGDDHQFHAAIWELYVHELFRAAGYSVTVHPASPTTRARPDFLVRRGESEAYVECVAVLPSRRESIAAKRSSRLIEALNSVHADGYWLDVDIDAWGSVTPPVRKVKAEVERWLSTLDHGQVRAQFDVGDYRRLPEKTFVLADWRVTIRPIPRSVSGDRFGAIGVFPAFEFTSRRGALERRVREKLAAMPTDREAILAVMIHEPFLDDDDLRAYLAGALARRPINGAESRPIRGNAGGLLIVANLFAWTVATATPTLWKFGKSLSGLELPIAAEVSVTSIDELEAAPTRPASEASWKFFGLSQDWPGTPFKDPA